MERYQRKIILTENLDYLYDENTSIQDGLFRLNPVELMTTVDWTLYDDEVDVLNEVYSILFEEFVMERKTIICYWPTFKFYDGTLNNFREHCSEAQIKMNVVDSDSRCTNTKHIPFEYQELWASMILFLVQSLVEDIKLNEAIEGIGTLTNRNENIWIFSMINGSKIKYSFLSESVNLFIIDTLKNESSYCERDRVAMYPTFLKLIEFLKTLYDLKEFTPNFSQKSYVNEYDKVLKQNLISNNLVDSWFSTLSNN